MALAGADILSVSSNQYCDAYVLSESSLFVWDHKILLITCGNTQLVIAALLLLEKAGVDHIESFTYQRKSECKPQLQATRFEEDCQQLRAKVAGKAYRVGHLDGHHHYLFCSHHAAKLPQSTRLLMYQAKGNAAAYLQQENQVKSNILALLKLEQLLPNFHFDAHLFEPYGYSVNGLYHTQFLTMHITPQTDNTYVSLETNVSHAAELSLLLAQMLTLFNPSSWDVISVNSAAIPCEDFEDWPPQEVTTCDVMLSHAGCFKYTHYIQTVSDVLTVTVL